MSRMQRVKDAIGATVTKLRADVESSHKSGKIPADYSLGFTNGLIFAEHHINMRDGSPKFYDRTTSVGSLPKPVALQTGSIQGAEEIFESLRDKLILEVRNYLDSSNADRGPVVDALKQLDGFIDNLEEVKKESTDGKS